nr:RNA-directed DNA polymerase, eukaryota [Tanacetum cinerariifolium]
MVVVWWMAAVWWMVADVGRRREDVCVFLLEIKRNRSYDTTPKMMNVGNKVGIFASVIKMGKPQPLNSEDMKPTLVLDESCNVYWALAKEVHGWIPEFRDDKYEANSSDEESLGNGSKGLMGENLNEQFKEQDTDVEEVSESSFINRSAHIYSNQVKNSKGGKLTTQFEDPFKIYAILNKKQETQVDTMDSHLKFPPECDKKAGGSFLKSLDELVKVGHTMGYKIDGCMKNMEDIIDVQGDKECFQMNVISLNIQGLGHKAKKVGPSVGNSSGILCVWEPNVFVKENVTVYDSFITIIGVWVPTSTRLLIISIYAPQDLTEKQMLWDYLSHIIDRWDGESVILGEFNEARTEGERYGSRFNV